MYDGDHFGEIALIVRNSLRVASVVTVEVCEVNRLDRIDFLHAILPYPDLLTRIEQIAYDRMVMTKEMDKRVHTN